MTVLLPGPTVDKELVVYLPAKTKEHLWTRWNHRREPAGKNFSDLLVLEPSFRNQMCDSVTKRMALNEIARPLNIKSIGTTVVTDSFGTLELIANSLPLSNLPQLPAVPIPPKSPASALLEDERPSIMHVSRENETTLSIDLTYPLTAYMAASIAITLLDGKAATNFTEFNPVRSTNNQLAPEIMERIVRANL